MQEAEDFLSSDFRSVALLAESTQSDEGCPLMGDSDILSEDDCKSRWSDRSHSDLNEDRKRLLRA